MRHIYDHKAPKQAANLSINSDLLKVARASGVNLSALLEEALTQRVGAARREAWLRDNAEAIATYNEFVADYGVFSDGSRSF